MKKFNIEDEIFEVLGFVEKKPTSKISLHYRYIDFLSGLRLVFVDGRFFLATKFHKPIELLIDTDDELTDFVKMASSNWMKHTLLRFKTFFKNLFKN